MRRLSGLVAALVVLGVGTGTAQYFGQNKVKYRTFDWQIVQTDHFEVYFYERERAAALDAARMAERGYARFSRILRHQFKTRKPIILYASQSDFSQTNTTGEDLTEGTGGFTEPFKHRMVLPFTGAYADFEHVLQHEMVHQFQFDVFSHGQIGGGLQALQAVQPPLWFMEGMAEYLSLGPVDPLTTMWLRDAALEGGLPTIEQLTFDPRIFPYRFGHAIWAYVGEKWGDETIGEILQGSVSNGVEGAFRRALGRSLAELSDEWRDAIQSLFLPQLADHYRAQRIAKPLLTARRTGGTLNLAAALSPDGKDVAFFSERNSIFVDLWLADGETGRVKRRLVKATLNSNFESLRFITSSGSFSPDGKYFAISAKRTDKDDLVILDVQKDREVRRIRVPLNGIANPVWSPDGHQLAFTGYDGGLTDLFLVNADGTDLRRLSNDGYADLLAAWSPDGKTIAFTTDRGPDTDLKVLRFGNMRIGLYHIDTGNIEILDHMDRGRNINPVWAPDGKSLAFVSDRTGIANVFLYDFIDKHIYQLTNVFTGVSGITPLSPALSWARQADRLAFAYFERGDFNVYEIDNPRSLRSEPYRDGPKLPPVSLLSPIGDTSRASRPGPPSSDPPDVHATASVYRSPSGLRSSSDVPSPADSSAAPVVVSVRSLLDSATLALPDTTAFAIRKYRTRFSTDFVAQPTIGYTRDAWGSGISGGTAISMSDMLGDRQLTLAAQLNGHIEEAQVLAAYSDQRHRSRLTYAASQSPSFFYAPSSVTPTTTPGQPTGTTVFTTRVRRLVTRDLFAGASRPLNRFNRMEIGFHLINLSDAVLEQRQYFTPSGIYLGSNNVQSTLNPSIAYAQPTLALVHDNTLFGFVGPFAGSRTRLQVAPAVGGWQFVSTIADFRRYFFASPFTLAVRGLLWGRFGRDADQLYVFLGNTELMRGYTAGSLIDHECYARVSSIGPLTGGSLGSTGCGQLDQLNGSRIAVTNIELRFPLTRSLQLGFLPIGFPPIEGAFFFDMGLAWQNGVTIKWDRSPLENPVAVRTPLKSWGGSIRANMLGLFIMRLDYTKPLDRVYDHPYWTFSLGPTF